MNITFLIGNGFDLNIGLATTYSAFLEHYTTNTENDSDIIQYFKKSILSNTELWSDAEMAFGRATEQFRKDGYLAEDFCNCHEDFCVKLANYLENQEQRLNYSAMKDALLRGFAKGIQNYKNGFRETEKEALTIDENTFSGGYSFNFISFNYTCVVDLCYQFLKSNTKILERRRYGNTVHDTQLGNLIHVHGTVNRDMVLGLNDISQIADPTMFDGVEEAYINEIIKQRTNEANAQNTDKKVFDLLKKSDLIYIYGMSIGATDKLWWNRICSLMKQKDNLHLIIHKFDAPEDGLIRRRFLQFSSRAKMEFTEFSEFDLDTMRKIETRIHIDRTNIFEELKDAVKASANVSIDNEVALTI